MRAGTPQAQAAAFQAAYAGDIPPPETVRLADEHLPMWRALTRGRARDEWAEVDKVHGANLCRCLYDIERISEELRQEGDTLTNDRGTRIVNPKHSLLQILSQRAVLLTKLLHLHAGAIVENASNLSHKREQDAKAREHAAAVKGAAAEDGDDDLLARPILQ